MSDETEHTRPSEADFDGRPTSQEFLILAEKVTQLEDRVDAIALVDLAAIYQQLERTSKALEAFALEAFEVSANEGAIGQAELSRLSQDIEKVRRETQALRESIEARMHGMERRLEAQEEKFSSRRSVSSLFRGARARWRPAEDGERKT